MVNKNINIPKATKNKNIKKLLIGLRLNIVIGVPRNVAPAPAIRAKTIANPPTTKAIESINAPIIKPTIVESTPNIIGDRANSATAIKIYFKVLLSLSAAILSEVE